MSHADLSLLGAEFTCDPLAFLSAHRGQRVVRFRLNDQSHVLINDVRAVHELLVGQADKFTRTEFTRESLRPFLGTGLLTADGAQHRRQRRLMQPAFHHHRIEAYAEVMVRHIAQALDGWHPGDCLDVLEAMTHISLGVVTESLFGENSSDAAADLHQMLVLMQAAQAAELGRGHAFDERLSYVTNDARTIIGRIDERIHSLIQRRRASSAPGADLLGMLLTAAEDAQDTGMSDQQIRDEIITLFIAGHETTSVTLTWAFWLLGRHPAVLEALSDEVDTRLGAGRATPEQLAGLQMPTRIIRETLRLYPTAWILFNRLAAEPAQLHDIAVMPGEIVILSPYAIQRDPRYFPDPDAFNPAHFVDGWEKQREKFSYFPFGGGSRICIGQHFALMEAAFLLAMVAQRFRFRLTMPEAHITPQPLTTLQPDVPIEIELIAR